MFSTDMISIIGGSLILSVLHALIPNHWLPVLAISRKENWSLNRTTYVTFLSGLSHALSTVGIGIAIGLVGLKLARHVEEFTRIIAPAILTSLGLFYIYQHHRHKHFHLHGNSSVSTRNVVASLAVAMFFSPCLEIEAYYLMAGAHGWRHVAILSLLYSSVTIAGMVIWVRLAYTGLFRANWHSLEHNAGIVTGVTLVATGILSFFFH